MVRIETTIPVILLLSVYLSATSIAFAQNPEPLPPQFPATGDKQVFQKQVSGAYSEVIAIAEIAKVVMESYESKFTLIGSALAYSGFFLLL